jgi:carbon monoxide dehydrogenase subunit G
MEIQSSRLIPAAPAVVWQALNDPEVLKECIPGCESFTRESDSTWRAVVAAKVGPVSARFTGTIELADVTPPTSYTLKFQGQGGAAGFANGDAKVELSPAAAGQTTLSYSARAQVGGKLAQIGSRLIDGAAAKIAEEFFERFSARLAAPETVAAPMEAVVAETGEVVKVDSGRAPDGSPWIRWVSLVLIAGIVAFLAWRFR